MNIRVCANNSAINYARELLSVISTVHACNSFTAANYEATSVIYSTVIIFPEVRTVSMCT